MEAAMYRNLATIAGAFAILAGSVLVSDPAQAGASASAPSKNTHSSQVAVAHPVRTDRQAQRTGVAITEFSSSSFRTPSYGQAYR
jgi:hypothetical protein